jgi:ZIP family zinc transporter
MRHALGARFATIGVSMIRGGAVSAVAVAAVFLSNVPEGLSSAAGMRQAGRSRTYVFGVWGAIAAISAIASLAGYAVFNRFSADVIAAITAVAAVRFSACWPTR